MAQTTVKPKKAAAPRTAAKRTRAKRKTSRRPPTEPTAAEIEARKAVARAFFNPTSAAAARTAFLKRQPGASHAG